MFCEELPQIEWFANNNPYTESLELFHYIIIPSVKEELITVKIWYDPYCYEKNIENIACEASFPITKSGRNQAIEYIREKYIEYMQ